MSNMKEKNNLFFMILIILLISIIMCISSFGIATWARYRSIIGNNIEAQIAKWSFKVNGEEEQFADINLADTIAFEHVEKTKVAPGTYGAFDLVIDGSGSEVSIEYYIDINITDKPTNMKFYEDAQFSNELQIVDNKIQIEDEILLPDISIPVTKTIYWKWDYRTQNMPNESVLNSYTGEINGLQTLINEYNEVGKTEEQKSEIIMKINDKIDTYEQGGDVILGVSVKGVQKHPNGFKLKNTYVSGGVQNQFSIGDTIGIVVEYTGNVYADENQTPITAETAPVVTIVNDTTQNAENNIIKVASLEKIPISLADNTVRTARFVSVSGNKINYEYEIKITDVGRLRIDNVQQGNIYNENGVLVRQISATIANEVIQVSNKVKLYTAQGLQDLQEAVNSAIFMGELDIELMNNINMSSFCSEEIGSWVPIGTEAAPCVINFDGKGRTISGLYITGTRNGVGLFGALNNSTVKDLNIGGTVISSYSDVGLLAGKVTNSTINNIVINNESSVVGLNNTGGLVGYANSTTFDRIFNNANVQGRLNVGGILGANDKTSRNTITESANEINGTITGVGHVGGISGHNAIVERCYNKGNIVGTGDDGTGYTSVGGIQGTGGLIYDCYNCGNISGAKGQAAGIKGNGYNNGSNHIQRCYNIGTISGSGRAIGSIVGENNTSSINTCFYTSSQNACGYRGSASNTRSVTVSEITTSGFGATNLGECWTDDRTGNNSINNGYPILKWQIGE